MAHSAQEVGSLLAAVALEKDLASSGGAPCGETLPEGAGYIIYLLFGE